MKRKMMTTAALMMLAMTGAWAQGPNNSGTYYMNADGKSGEALKTALSKIISVKKHSPSYDELLELYKTTDTRADGYVRDWYSNITNFTHITDKAGNYQKEGDVYNREHSVPQSWGSPKADIVHVVPTDGYVNNMRGNLPFGEVGTASYQSANGYSKVGACKTPGYTKKVFEPNDEVKGDLARIYFYMATCYESTITTWSGGGIITGTKYQPYVQWTFDMLVRWSKLDPVDDVERARNAAIARSNVQGNRNPFVDYPGLEDYIWGDKMNEVFSYDNYDSGGTTVVERVAKPVFTPDGGTFADSVVVTISSSTADAIIYYTTDGTDASANSTVYRGPVTLKANTTLKAMAMKEGMANSYPSTASYVITTTGGGGGEVTPGECTIALNNNLFGTSFSGALGNNAMGTFTGTQGSIVVSYAKGTGSNMYINSSQIRMYAGNTLTISSLKAPITSLEFTIDPSSSGKSLTASTGTVSGGTWTGSAESVTFKVNDGSGNLRLTSVRVTVENAVTTLDGDITGDGNVDSADLAALVQCIFKNVVHSTEASKADVNKDGQVDVADIITLIKIMIDRVR